MVEGIVLCGGFGTRLKSLISNVPKPMAPILGRPFLEVLLSDLANKGFEHLILSVGYLGEVIQNHFKDSFHGVKLSYCVEDRPLGTGGAIRLALNQCQKSPVFIFNGDTFLEFELGLLQQRWEAARAPIIVGKAVPEVSRYGTLLEEAGRIVGFLEKGQTGAGIISTGCYVFPKNQLDEKPLYEPFSIETDYLFSAVKKQRFELFLSQGAFIDIGVPEDYLRAQTFFTDKM